MNAPFEPRTDRGPRCEPDALLPALTPERAVGSLRAFLDVIGQWRVDYVVVGGAAALLQGAPVETHDIDAFFLIDPADRISEIQSLLTTQWHCAWLTGGGWWDSHDNLVAGVPYDFRLIPIGDRIFEDFLLHRQRMAFGAVQVDLRTRPKLITDVADRIANRVNDHVDVSRLLHYRRRLDLLRQHFG